MSVLSRDPRGLSWCRPSIVYLHVRLLPSAILRVAAWLRECESRRDRSFCVRGRAMSAAGHTLHVSLIATPDAQVSPLSGLFETLNAFGLLAKFEPGIPERPFEVEIVASNR